MYQPQVIGEVDLVYFTELRQFVDEVSEQFPDPSQQRFVYEPLEFPVDEAGNEQLLLFKKRWFKLLGTVLHLEVDVLRQLAAQFHYQKQAVFLAAFKRCIALLKADDGLLKQYLYFFVEYIFGNKCSATYKEACHCLVAVKSNVRVSADAEQVVELLRKYYQFLSFANQALVNNEVLQG